jgi:hypothetical protein
LLELRLIYPTSVRSRLELPELLRINRGYTLEPFSGLLNETNGAIVVVRMVGALERLLEAALALY